ncbi:hypothetical protein AKJ36_02080 [candidate division MSBL1 archaeon SCGC-AAA259I07]|uniref:HTH marR-type domain-containing protein n=1 Tax=candidate division MSBL1 archaeon SCGC-AAA259I07 TaxID=1698266 RepID=A0A133UKW2_9EURY|nr:hypothetical protein AKJ36_02080 [candidate division MSBL1 archaeon SCGC-AAA259I07]
MGLVDRLKELSPAKLRERPMGPMTPTDYEIIECLLGREGYVLPKEIEENTEVSQSAAYRRLRKMKGEGIVSHKRGEGFKLVLRKRYFPFHLLAIGLLCFVLGIAFFQNVLLALGGVVFCIGVFLDWVLDLSH